MFRRAFALFALALFSGALAPEWAQDPKPEPMRIIVVESLAHAQQILSRLRKGEDFADIARKESLDPSASDGGYTGELDPASMRSELREAVSHLKPGEVSPPIQLPQGVALVTVLQRSPSEQKPSSAAAMLPIAAAGQVHYSLNISGYGEGLVARRAYFESLPPEQQTEKTACDSFDQIAQARQRVKDMILGRNPSPEQAGIGKFTIGQLWASEGKLDEAIGNWKDALAIAEQQQSDMSLQMEMMLGVAYLQRASAGDWATGGPVDRTRLFPTKPGSLHPNEADVQQSITYFKEILKRQPENLEARWLLNTAYMVAGNYPDGVPPEFLIPPRTWKQNPDIPHFIDVSPGAGLHFRTMSGGLIVDDFDGDGLLDIVTSEIDDCAPLRFFHNNGDGTFSDRSKQSGLANTYGGLNLIQADYDNDGCLDILVLRGAWEFARRLTLLHNNCDGTFSDVTDRSGLGRTPTSTNSAVWADIDNDGKLDLFIANENSPNQLFLNNGDGTFTDISHAAGIDTSTFAKSVVAADYDGDGLPDFYVSNSGSEHLLFHNNGNGTFSEVAEKAGVQMPRQSFGAAFFDYDNDGKPDLYVSSYYASLDEVTRTYLGLPNNAETMKLYRNKGDGTFEDVTSKVGLDKVYMPMGFNLGDIDNDGYLDLYLGSGNPSYGMRIPNVLLHNRNGKSFEDVSFSSGTAAMEKGHGIAFADFTNTGQQDIAVVMGGAVRGDAHTFRLFHNPGNSNSWLTVHLRGVKTNRSAIGARIKVSVTDGKTQRSVWRTVGSGGSFGAEPLEQHIGIGKNASIESVDVWWPASHAHQHFSNVKPNQAIEVVEFAADYKPLRRRTYQFQIKEQAGSLAASRR